MILLFLAIAIGVGLATYEFSPKAHTWTDEHAQAIRAAFSAHQAADAKLDAAQAAVDVHAATQGTPAPAAPGAPPTGPYDPIALLHHAWDSFKAAAQSNAAAAAYTTTALKTAKTDQQKAAADQSAALVDARQQQITAALKTFGSGECDVRSYAHVTSQIRDALLAKLHSRGMTVTGNNPWDIDTHDHDVKLRALWDPREQVLKLIVTAGAGGILQGELPAMLVCPEVWKKIDPVMKEILGS